MGQHLPRLIKVCLTNWKIYMQIYVKGIKNFSVMDTYNI